MLKNVRRQKLNGHVVSLSKIDIEGHVPGLAVVVEMYQDIVNVDAAVGTGVAGAPEDAGRHDEGCGTGEDRGEAALEDLPAGKELGRL